MDGVWEKAANVGAHDVPLLSHGVGNPTLLTLVGFSLIILAIGSPYFLAYLTHPQWPEKTRRQALRVSSGIIVFGVILLALAFVLWTVRQTTTHGTDPDTSEPTPTTTAMPTTSTTPTPARTSVFPSLTPPPNHACASEGLTTVENASEFLLITVPASWCEVSTNRISGAPGIKAAPSLDDLANRSGSGVEFAAMTPPIGPSSVDFILDVVGGDPSLLRCTYEGRFDYQRKSYVGKFEKWTNCGGPLTDVVVVAAMPSDGRYLALVTILIKSEAERNVLDEILNSWEVLTERDGG